MGLGNKMKIIPKDPGVIHFVGIGGIGMSGIACLLHAMGYKVQGSDIANTGYVLESVKAQGIKCFVGHDQNNVKDISLLIVSTAIKKDNPELIYAQQNNVPVIHRSEMLAELMRFKHSIAVSGTHGKTTTTTMLAALFEAMGDDPTVINGGVVNHRNSNAYLGKSNFLIAEADESDKTFIKVPAYVAIITNIDPEHLEHYDNDFENVKSAYQQFIANIPFYGFAVVCFDHPVVKEVVEKVHNRKIITYGVINKEVDLFATNIRNSDGKTVFDIMLSDNICESLQLESNIIENIVLNSYGQHNVSNYLAAIAVGLEHGLTFSDTKHALDNFKGAKRRFTHVAEVEGKLIIDDYAHHPVEIEATLQAAKALANTRKGRVIAIMEPHKYTRLRDNLEGFATSFAYADCVAITDVYSAGEQMIDGIDSDILSQKIACENKKVCRVKDIDAMVEYVNSNSADKDVVIFLGAGSITKWAYLLPEKIKKYRLICNTY